MPRPAERHRTMGDHRGPASKSSQPWFSPAPDQALGLWFHLLLGRRLRSNLPRGHEQLAGLLEVFQKAIVYGFQLICCLADPGCQRGAVQINVLSNIDLSLAIQRQVVSVFGNDHAGHSCLGRHATLDQARFGGSLHNACLAGSTGEFWAAGYNDAELGRDDVYGQDLLTSSNPKKYLTQCLPTLGG